jgi:hypothetical protein
MFVVAVIALGLYWLETREHRGTLQELGGLKVDHQRALDIIGGMVEEDEGQD